MYNQRIFKHFIICFGGILLSIYGCQKVPKGFLSDNIYYAVNPFSVPQSITTVSAPMVTDGSTSPLNVKLLAIKNVATSADVSKIFLTPDTIRIYKGSVTSNDSTLALLNSKLKDSTVAPFSVNSVGGRLQFTQATQYVSQGKYAIDVEVSNIRGSRIINNACLINITPTVADTLLYKAYSQSDSLFTSFSTVAASNFNVNISRNPAGPNKIVFVWKDKTGQKFNPAKGEIKGRPNRPNFTDWNPYYPQIKTDTSIEYRYPQGVPILPVFANPAKYPGFNDGISYYTINGKNVDAGKNVNTTFTIKYFATKGTYYVTLNMADIARKP